MSNRSYRVMPVGELFARSGPPLPRTYAAWPVWHDSTPADVNFHPLPKKQAIRIWTKRADSSATPGNRGDRTAR